MRSKYTNRFNSKGSDDIGFEADQLFAKLARKRGWTTIESTREQDRIEHWDYALRQDNDVYYVEVKGLKRLNRQAHQDDKMVCLELQGNAGYPGWLYGKSTHIAFLMKEGFVMIDRKKLVEKIESIIDVNGEIHESIPNKKLHTIYRRVKYGHKDKIVYITKDELLTVPHKIWEVDDV
jgi:hypothetical protein